MPSGSPQQRVHYGCHEFRDDVERVIKGRAHPELAQLVQVHLASCRDCQRYHDRLDSIYQRPRAVAPLDSFARDHEFDAILARAKAHGQRHAQARERRRVGASVSVAGLTGVALILALALIFPSFGARLFQPPAVAQLELRPDTSYTSYGDDIRIPARHSLAHQAQKFARVIGLELGTELGSTASRFELTDAEGRTTAGDSLTVGTRITTHEAGVQVAFVGRMIANFQPHTITRWSSASPTLVELGLISGSLAIRYDRRPGDPILQVRTPTAVVRVVGTVFTVAVDDDGRTRVSVLRGKVVVLDPSSGRSLGEVGAGYTFDVADSSYRDVGRQEVAAALPLADQSVRLDQPGRELGQIPRAWTVPGLSDDPAERILDRVLDPGGSTAGPTGAGAQVARASSPITISRRGAAKREDNGEAATLELIDKQLRREHDRRALVEGRLERCRVLQAEPETRFRAARCLGDFMSELGDEPEAVEGLLLLGTLRMDFAHDYQSATRNFEEFLRRAPQHPKAELARYKLVLAEIEAGYIPHALQRGRAYLRYYPDGQYVGRILQRFPELKSEI